MTGYGHKEETSYYWGLLLRSPRLWTSIAAGAVGFIVGMSAFSCSNASQMERASPRASSRPAQPGLATITMMSRPQPSASVVLSTALLPGGLADAVAPSAIAAEERGPERPLTATSSIQAPLESGLPISVSGRADDLAVLMTISSGKAGPSEVNFYFFDTDGTDRSVVKMIARLTYLDFGAPIAEIEMDEGHPGHAYFFGTYFQHPGRWRLDLVIKRAELRDAVASFEVSIR